MILMGGQNKSHSCVPAIQVRSKAARRGCKECKEYIQDRISKVALWLCFSRFVPVDYNPGTAQVPLSWSHEAVLDIAIEVSNYYP